MTPEPPPITEDGITAPYWDACRRGELRLQRCTACGTFLHFPGLACSACGSADLDWAKVAGTGTVYSFVVVHQTANPRFKSRVPYVVAWIELDEGPSARVLSDLVDCDPEKVRIGDPVELVFDHSWPGYVVPRFRPAIAKPRAERGA